MVPVLQPPRGVKKPKSADVYSDANSGAGRVGADIDAVTDADAGTGARFRADAAVEVITGIYFEDRRSNGRRMKRMRMRMRWRRW